MFAGYARTRNSTLKADVQPRDDCKGCHNCTANVKSSIVESCCVAKQRGCSQEDTCLNRWKCVPWQQCGQLGQEQQRALACPHGPSAQLLPAPAKLCRTPGQPPGQPSAPAHFVKLRQVTQAPTEGSGCNNDVDNNNNNSSFSDKICESTDEAEE